MCLSIKRSVFRITCSVVAIVTTLCLNGCVKNPDKTGQRSVYNIDSLISVQLTSLKGRELIKSVTINGKSEETKFAPDSLQWVYELEIFKQIDQVNKAEFRATYVTNEARDVSSNLMVREFKAQGESLKLYFLRSLNDVRKIEATLVEDNSLYTDTKKLTLEFERNHLLQRYRIEGHQKMAMNDSLKFVVAGVVE